MPETKVITSSTVTSIVGSDISIITSYREVADTNILPDTISAFIGDKVATFDGTSYIEGELIIQMKNNPLQIDYSIDANGNLVVISNQGDENKYSIDSNGNLIYTE